MTEPQRTTLPSIQAFKRRYDEYLGSLDYTLDQSLARIAAISGFTAGWQAFREELIGKPAADAKADALVAQEHAQGTLREVPPTAAADWEEPTNG